MLEPTLDRWRCIWRERAVQGCYHYNHRGAVAVVLDKWGSVVSEPEQGRSLFGEVMVPGSGVAGAHGAQADFGRPGLTTKHRDAAASAWGYGDSLPGHSVGKDYFGARWYDPSTARWLSEEPLGLDGPSAYTYLGGDAQRLVDITGFAGISPAFPTIGDAGSPAPLSPVDAAALVACSHLNADEEAYFPGSPERVGVILQGNGKTGHTRLNGGGPHGGVFSPKIWNNPIVVATYHNHPNGEPFTENNDVDSADKMSDARQRSIPFYLCLPNGQVRVYRPERGAGGNFGQDGTVGYSDYVGSWF